MPDQWSDEPLFDLPDGRPLEQAALDLPDAKPEWIRYRPLVRIPCQECIALLHEAGGVGPYARSARWRMKFKTVTLMLCHEHAILRRTEQ